ncbi:calcium and integrin-binding protein 1 [Calliopsis andreniformis]|uniref:calcium and integrin-binding protein 1 n=1 Tax=Calliopsis andreniformis TaxID=337506 RepID=UPI003FCD38D0
MGIFLSTDSILNEETVATYAELSYLSKSEIRHITQLLDNTDPGKLRENLQHRFTLEQIDEVLPQIQCSPFRDSIYRVFSSEDDGCLGLEDVLDLCSVFSANCPEEVQAAWAFRIFDFDDDNQISLDDLIEAVQRLTRNEQGDYGCADMAESGHVARRVLQEMVFNRSGTILPEEFTHFISRISEFSPSFRFRV